jgi:hypothetical protein
VSNEPTGLLESHIEKKGIEYPIAKVKGESAKTIYGVRGFPSAALVDGSGRVIWTGHPGSLKNSDIEAALESVSFLAPLDGKQHKKLNKLISDRDFGKALVAAQKDLAKNPSDEDLKGLVTSIEEMLTGFQTSAASAVDSGDFASAMSFYSDIENSFDGLDAAKDAKNNAKLLSKNPAAKDELAAWSKMAKGDKAQFEGDFEKASKAYSSVAKKYPDTKSGKLAAAFLSRHPLK